MRYLLIFRNQQIKNRNGCEYMYCKNCKKEIKEVIFCPYCGEKQFSENENTDKKKRYMRIVICLLCVVFMLALINRKKLPEINTEQIIAGLSEAGANAVYLGENVFFLGIDSLEILEKEISKDEILSVKCDVRMSDAIMSAKAQYSLVYELQDNYWILEDYIMSNLEYVKPKQGIDENIVFETVDFVNILCDGDEEKIELLRPHIESTLNFEQESRTTDLENGVDKFFIVYKYRTHTKETEGRIYLAYNFTDGQWVPNDMKKLTSNSKWLLEGKWDFDIYTYYVEVIIRSVDWEAMEAQVEYKGSVWQGGGEMHSTTVGLTESGSWIAFTPLVVPAEDYLSNDRYIMLWVKEDDMYYEAPSMFRGEPNVHLPIGGKVQ